MKSHAHVGRGCSRVGCRSIATMTLTYIYAESTAVVGPLATFSEPHAYDLCAIHGERLKVPHGWNVIKQELTGNEPGPSDDDLMAIADAVREVARRSDENVQTLSEDKAQTPIGRRGHLRAVPS
ncbi:unannotated protein [freshwater metagenome]|uniref:Unannotated protein n=1 Tax=freshwater metagenome TaxID=449393 RepID=A0A6J6UTU1_9ZZZZ|nr:DUF3499 family protein [Actinomycetota bacterium]MSX73002.1 DUF3499 family protein [Actinomycetota bacterium]MSZ00934.1 DUF3499 family protein [Actinomycetota bacterium]MTA59446.1 DUF3499 family protein [Actinomycetota bacterium]MTB20068.1 DUF3499 family protein [Actinomycetota bacterium]